MEDLDTQLSGYEKDRMHRQALAKEKKQEGKEKKQKEQETKEGRKKEIENLPDKADDSSKRTFKQQVLSKLNQGTTQSGKQLAGRLAKSMLKKFLFWLGGIIVSLWWLWAILIALFLLVALSVGLAKKACDHDLTKFIATTVFSISCDEPKAEVAGGGGGSGSEEDKSKETWEANGCKSTGETNAEGGSSCGGSCEGFDPTNIKSNQCSDASPSLTKLLDCMKDDMGNFDLAQSDIKLTSISDDHGLSKCRDNYSYQCPKGSNDPDCCFHTQGSCHYGGGTHTDGSYAVDIRLLSGDKDGKLKDLVKSCDGQWYPEPDHYHVSVKNCGKI